MLRMTLACSTAAVTHRRGSIMTSRSRNSGHSARRTTSDTAAAACRHGVTNRSSSTGGLTTTVRGEAGADPGAAVDPILRCNNQAYAVGKVRARRDG